MAGDDLSVFLFFLTCTVAFGVEAVKAETAVRRTSFAVIALGCLFSGVFWAHVKPLWPALTAQIQLVATNPVSWFVVLIFFLAVIAFHRPKGPAIQAQASVRAIDPPRPIPPLTNNVATTKTLVEAKTEQPEPREFLQVDAEYLLDLRKDRKYTHVQIDKMVVPYIGKWMKIEGQIRDILRPFLVMRFPRPTPEYPGDYYDIHVYFEPSQAERFYSLGVGHRISVIGKVRAVLYSEIELECGELQS
jgi:hypothetical protein